MYAKQATIDCVKLVWAQEHQHDVAPRLALKGRPLQEALTENKGQGAVGKSYPTCCGTGAKTSQELLSMHNQGSSPRFLTVAVPRPVSVPHGLSADFPQGKFGCCWGTLGFLTFTRENTGSKQQKWVAR